MSNNQNNPQDSLSKSHEFGKQTILSTKNDIQDNPQEVPQVKSVERTAQEIIQDIKDQYPTVGAKTGVELCMRRFADQQTDQLQSRISELEALQKSDDKHIKHLEKQIEDYQTVIDKHINSPQNYTDEHIINVMTQNQKYREALEGIRVTEYIEEKTILQSYMESIRIAEQALSHKENG